MPKIQSIKRQPWVEHDFQTGIPLGWTANIYVRLKDTPLRIAHYLSLDLKEQPNSDSWTVKQHVGHLFELDLLHINRLHQFSNFQNELVAADMSNRATEQANYNEWSTQKLNESFLNRRTLLLNTFEALDQEMFEHVAHHPRLDKKMRPTDILFFAAEHDDHHLASIQEILSGD